jgi:hypothetical protein
VPHAAEVHRVDMHAPGSPKRNRTTVRAHAVAIPHPSGNAVVGRAVTGMKIKGMPTFRTRARVWFDELATGLRDRPPTSASANEGNRCPNRAGQEQRARYPIDGSITEARHGSGSLARARYGTDPSLARRR